MNNEQLNIAANKYLTDKGCKRMSQTYIAYNIQKMLVDFHEQQVKNLNIDFVIGFLFNKAVEAHSWYLEEDKELGGDEANESKDMFKYEMQKKLKKLGVKIPDNCL